MVPPHTPSESLSASHNLLALLAEMDAASPSLAIATPERQRLTFTAWIARARAAEAILGGNWARQKVAQAAETLHRLSRLWWPGRIAALDPRSTPATAWHGAAQKHWQDVAVWCRARLERAENWADDAARIPPPYDAAELFAATCEVLCSFGGPLGHSIPLDRSPAVIADARRRLSSLVRAAATLRWLRGTAPAEAWGLAIGRARGLARAVGADNDFAGLLSPSIVPLKGWAIHLGRDPAREQVLGQIPRVDCSDAKLLTWLVSAFDVLDTPTLARLCMHLTTRIAGLQPQFADRRRRRRFDQLLLQLEPRPAPKTGQNAKQTSTGAHPADPRLPQLKAQLSGRRVLFISNRSAPEIEALLAEHLGVRCEAVASAGNPRRRQALLARIRQGSYDIVLVAHGFTGHADTEQFGAACRQAAVPFCMVDKGRLSRIVDALWTYRNHPRLATPAASPDSAA